MFNRQTDRLADAVRLLAAMAAFAHRPDVKGGLSLYDAARKVAAEPPPSLATLADQLIRSARETLQHYPDAPDDAETLYEQMVAACLLTDTEIVAANLDPARCTAAMQAKLTDREHTTGEMPRLFAAITEPALGPLLTSTAYTADLTPAYRRRVLETLENVAAKLDNLGAQTRDTLIVIAMKFGDPDADDRSDPDLRAFLLEKARDYRALSAQVEAIDERTAGLGNLKAAARDAIARADLEEVEALLSRVDEVETEIAAETKVLRADNALLRGRVEDAYRLLSAAADSFASVDPLEPARRRASYAGRLYRHGIRYGGAGIGFAERMLRAALGSLARSDEAELRRQVRQRLAATLEVQGQQGAGEVGEGFMAQAAEAYRAALDDFARAGDRTGWAAAQVGLGNVMRNRATRAPRAQREALLAGAIEANRAALGSCSEAEDPDLWAGASNNLGISLTMLGAMTPGAAGTRHLEQALEAFRAALRVRTETACPEDWAITQQNIANTLGDLAARAEGPEADRLIASSLEALRAALRVLTEADHPVDWALVQNSLGITLRDQAAREPTDTAGPRLEQAVDAFRAALRVYTEADDPANLALCHNNLGAALAEQGRRAGGEAGARLLAEAVVAYRAALRVTTETADPVGWAETTFNLGLAHAAMAENETCLDRRAEMTQAAECLEAALRVSDPKHMRFNFDEATTALQRIRKLAALS